MITKTYDPTPLATSPSSPRRDGYPMPHLARAGHRVTVYNRSPRRLGSGSPNTATRVLRRPRRQCGATSCSRASATTTTCARSCSRTWRVQRMKRAQSSSTTRRVGPGRARAERGGAAQGLHFIDARSRAATSRDQRHADRDVRRRCGAFDAMRPAAMAFAKAVTLLGRAARVSSRRW